MQMPWLRCAFLPTSDYFLTTNAGPFCAHGQRTGLRHFEYDCEAGVAKLVNQTSFRLTHFTSTSSGRRIGNCRHTLMHESSSCT